MAFQMHVLTTSVCSIVAAVVLPGLCDPALADAPSLQHQVEGAFIYNFTQYVEWPPQAFADGGSPFVVMVIGDDAFAKELEQIMAGKAVEKRQIVVQHCASADKIGGCQILFVPASQNNSLKTIIEAIGTKPVLTVGESDSFMPDGGGIRLFVEDGKMKFELDPDVLEASKLRPSAKLMKLARIYHR
jgi:hypothetical protein